MRLFHEERSHHVMETNGEALLAAVGFDALLNPGRLRITAAHRDHAARWASGALIRGDVRQFLTSDEFDKPKPLPRFDYMETLEQLSEGVDVQQLQEKFEGNDSDETMALVMAASAAVEYLSGIIPKRSRVTIMGPKPTAPSDADVARFRRAHATVQRPALLFEDLNEGALASDQVRAFAAVYPSLYELTKTAVFEALVDIKAKRPKFEVSSKRDRQLQVLMQTRTVTPQLLKSLQQAFEVADQGEGGAPPKRPLKVDTDATQSPIQRATFK